MIRIVSRAVLLCCALLSGNLLIAQNSRLENYLRDSLDIVMNHELARWDVPGAAVCVVKGNQVLVAKGYGKRDLEKTAPVDENTLFMIGSNTKAFTATALAMLADEKKCDLGDRVQKWLPGFTMKDPWVAEHLTLTDILCHRIGMETFQGDFTYWTSTLTAGEVLEKFGKMTPAFDFRTRYGYTNAGFATAGACIKAISGMEWGDFVRERLFAPLDMKNTVPYSQQAKNSDNLASPYTKVEGKLTAIDFANIDNLAPAGSIASSVHDMSHWLIAQLNSGKYNGVDVIPPAVIRRTRQPETIVSRVNQPGSHYELYGLGWFLQDYHGKELVSHTGGVNGYVTSVTLIPEEKIGIVVLTNTDANGLFLSMNKVLVDEALDLPYFDYNTRYFIGFQHYDEQGLNEIKGWRDTVAMHLPEALPLKAYAGHYVNEVYGSIDIHEEKGTLVMHFQHHTMTGKLEPLGGNRFMVTYSDPMMGIKALPFTAENGKVKSFVLSVADMVETTTYTFNISD